MAEALGYLKEESQSHGFAIPAYCFMPDHLHWLASGTHAKANCLEFMKNFKQRSSFAFKQKSGHRLWQDKTHDHILRPNERWEAVAYYIWMNPVRKGLCARPEEWPHSGSLTMDWKRLVMPPEELWIPPWKKGT